MKLKHMPKYLKYFVLRAHAMGYVCAQSFSPVQPFVTPWTVASQAPLSLEFLRQE